MKKNFSLRASSAHAMNTKTNVVHIIIHRAPSFTSHEHYYIEINNLAFSIAVSDGYKYNDIKH
jgi:hypothetical protein